MKKLPIGIQNFREIIEEGYLYADKTEYVYNLIQDAKYYFLSRPRRFGKSLLLDTIAEVFSGDRELFKGLWIYESDYEFKKHPVIRIDMSNVATDTPERLGKSLMEHLANCYLAEGLECTSSIESNAFARLIEELHKKYGERAVILIDEYDKPILDHITELDVAEANRRVIKGFYGILKSMDAHLEFTFMTGVSKFTKTSVFSELNNMVDITMMERYANICGFTIEDFDVHFATHLKDLHSVKNLQHHKDVRGEILKWYDGYSWDGETRVLNPFSLLSFFNRQYFGNFWYDSGTPGFLVKLIKEKPNAYANIHDITVTEAILNAGELDRISVGPLMFQSGYLTVKKVNYRSAPPEYVLEIPNREVKDAFNLHVLESLTEKDSVDTRSLSVKIRSALKAGDMQEVLSVLRSLFASIPYELHVNKEAYYHSIFYALMSFVGLDIDAEVSTSSGRVDAIMEYDEKIYIMEFKYKDCDIKADDETKRKLFDEALADALAQIEERGYYKKYLGSGKILFNIALAFLGRDDIDIRYQIQPNRLM